jgi:DNA-binding MarR family transcriptional regulator
VTARRLDLVQVVGRIQRASRLLEKELGRRFAGHDLQLWEFDILATLLRSGPPYRLTAGALGGASMVTSGAMSNRIHRLVDKGLVHRETDPSNLRSVLISLTDRGRELAGRILGGHADNETRLLAPLTPEEREHLADLLRKPLMSLGGTPPART